MQLLYQLVHYCVKCTDQGEVGVRVAVTGITEGRVELKVEVFDTGPGMTEEVLALLSPSGSTYQLFRK